MTTEGIEAVFLETHNWGQAARFFQDLGYQLEFDTGHSSGQLRNGAGPYLFIAEVPADQALGTSIVFRVADAEAFTPGPSVELAAPFSSTHWGTAEATVRDPDGREWTVQAPGKST